MSDRPPRSKPHRRQRRPKRSDNSAPSSSSSRPNKRQKPATAEKTPEYPSYPWASSEIARIRSEHEFSEFWADTPQHVCTFAGTGLFGSDDGQLNAAQFTQPRHIAFSSDGRIFISERRHRIRIISRDGLVSTFVGTSRAGCKDGSITEAEFDRPAGICFDANGDLLICDTNNHRIRKVDMKTNIVSTYVGKSSGFVDGHISVALLNSPESLTIGRDGTMFIADSVNYAIRKIAPDGTVSTILRGETPKVPLHAPTGPRGVAPISLKPAPTPISVVLSPSGTLYASFSSGLSSSISIIRFDANGATSTVTREIAVENEDPSKPKTLSRGPCYLGLAPDGTLLVSDSHRNKLYRFDGDKFHSFAGNGQHTTQNGSMQNASFSPAGFSFDNDEEDLYLCDSEGHRIRRICSPMMSSNGFSFEKMLDALSSPSSDLIGLKDVLLDPKDQLTLHNAPSGRQWMTSASVLGYVAPFIVSVGGGKVFESLSSPPNIIDTFVRLIHGADFDSLVLGQRSDGDVSNSSNGGEVRSTHTLTQLAHLYIISNLLKVPQLANICMSELTLTADSISETCVQAHFEDGLMDSLRATYACADSLIANVLYALLSKLKSSDCRATKFVLGTPKSEPTPSSKEVNSKDSIRVLLSSFVSHLYDSVVADQDEDDDEENASFPTNFRIQTFDRMASIHAPVMFCAWPFFHRAMKFGGHEVSARLMEFSEDFLTGDSLDVLLRFFYTGALPSTPVSDHYDESERSLYKEHCEAIADACAVIAENAAFFEIVSTDGVSSTERSLTRLLVACLSILLQGNTELWDTDQLDHWKRSLDAIWWERKWSAVALL